MSLQEIKFPNQQTWEKLLMRWSDFPVCGEKKLICAVIAAAIGDDKKENELASVADKTRFFGAGLEKYCRMINLDADFVREQVLIAARKVGQVVEITA